MRIGDEFEPEIKVLFNKVYYDCEVNFTVSDNNVADYSNGKLIAKTAGETTVTFTGKWLDFSSDKLITDIKIPFKTVDGNRIDDTPIHEALREYLKTLVIPELVNNRCVKVEYQTLEIKY